MGRQGDWGFCRIQRSRFGSGVVPKWYWLRSAVERFENLSALQELRSPETISMSHLDSFSVTSMNLAAAESDEISPEPCHGGRPMISMPHLPSSTHSPLYWLAHRDARTDMKIEHLAKVQSILQKNMNSSQCCHSPQPKWPSSKQFQGVLLNQWRISIYSWTFSNKRLQTHCTLLNEKVTSQNGTNVGIKEFHNVFGPTGTAL